ncbi:hypothetical protein D3C84_441650 [compost metagenome]
MTGAYKLTFKISLLVFFVLVTFFSVQNNALRFSESSSVLPSDRFSESLVLGRIVADDFNIDKQNWNLGFVGAGGPLDIELSYRIFSGEKQNSQLSFIPYVSQLGLQGELFSKIHRSFTKLDLGDLQAINLLFFSLVIAGLSFLYLKIYDLRFALVFLVTMISSPWVVSFAGNLYWVPFTWFLPAFFAALIYLNKSRSIRLVLLLGVAGSVFVKSLAGYEYLTTITLFACSVFVVAPFFNSTKFDLHANARMFVLSFIACVSGFVGALCLHANMRGETIWLGLKNIYEFDVKRRTYGDVSQFDHVYAASLESTPLDVIGKYWSDWATPVVTWLPGATLNVIFWFSLAGLIYSLLVKRKIELKNPVIIFYFALAPISWFFLAKAHSYIHTELNYVLWYFGFVQALLYVSSGFLKDFALGVYAIFKRIGPVFTLILLASVSLLSSFILCKYSNEAIDSLRSSPIASINIGHGFEVTFSEDGKMVFYNPDCRKADLNGFFILHAIPESFAEKAKQPNQFENLDFSWPGNKITVLNYFSQYRHGCLAEVKLPNYKLAGFLAGQYDLNDEGGINLRWQNKIDMPNGIPIEEVTPYNLTDSNWENGISKIRPSFFVPNRLTTRLSLSVGGRISFAHSKERKIVDIDYNETYINVYVDGDMLSPVHDGYPNNIKILR